MILTAYTIRCYRVKIVHRSVCKMSRGRSGMQDGEREQKGWLLSGLPIKLLELQNEGKPSGGIIRTGKCKTSYGRISWTDSARRSAPAVLRAGWPSGSPGMNADQQCCRDRRKKNSPPDTSGGEFFPNGGTAFSAFPQKFPSIFAQF